MRKLVGGPTTGGYHCSMMFCIMMKTWNSSLCQCWPLIHWSLTGRLWVNQSVPCNHTGPDEPCDPGHHFKPLLPHSAHDFPSWHVMNPLFLVYCPTVRRLQGLSWPLPDCFVFVCLSLGPERREWDSKRRSEKKKAIPFPGLITEAGGSDMSWLKQHHFCHSCLAADLTNDAGGSRHMPLSVV